MGKIKDSKYSELYNLFRKEYIGFSKELDELFKFYMSDIYFTKENSIGFSNKIINESIVNKLNSLSEKIKSISLHRINISLNTYISKYFEIFKSELKVKVSNEIYAFEDKIKTYANNITNSISKNINKNNYKSIISMFSGRIKTFCYMTLLYCLNKTCIRVNNENNYISIIVSDNNKLTNRLTNSHGYFLLKKSKEVKTLWDIKNNGYIYGDSPPSYFGSHEIIMPFKHVNIK